MSVRYNLYQRWYSNGATACVAPCASKSGCFIRSFQKTRFPKTKAGRCDRKIVAPRTRESNQDRLGLSPWGPRRRSLKLPRRPRQPATSRQGARLGARRRPPHPRPTTTDSTVILGSRTRPARILIALIPFESPPRHRDIPNLVTDPVVGSGKDAECQRRVHPFGRPCFVGVSLLV